MHSRRGWSILLAGTAVALLVQMAVAMVTTAVQQTPTIDEPVYAGAAVVQWQQHSLRYNAEHPPLGKTLIGAGLAVAEPRLDPSFDGDQTALGRRLLYESGNDPDHLLLLARLPMIALTLCFGVVVLLFARDAFGPVGGLAALALFAFSPDVIAHGSLATFDVPAAGFLLLAVWAAWRVRRRPRLWLAVAGLALGAALATRMSTLAAVPVVLLLVIVFGPRRDRLAGRRRSAYARTQVGACPARGRCGAGNRRRGRLGELPHGRPAAALDRAGGPAGHRGAPPLRRRVHAVSAAVPGRHANAVRHGGPDLGRISLRPRLRRVAAGTTCRRRCW